MVAGPHRARLSAPSMLAQPQEQQQPPEEPRSLSSWIHEARKGLQRRQQQDSDDNMSAADFFIPSLPGQPSDASVTMYGGHIPSAPPKNGVPDTESDAHLYFYLVRNKHIAETERTLLWFNGGPGCSSFDGGLMEIGPFRLVPNSDGKLRELEGAWNEYANVIFIDQPVGTGYSYMSTNEYLHDLPEAAAHVVEFLTKFYKIFPEFSSHDTYIAGESYAGQYIPYIAQAILETTRLPTQLKGILIGNGWIDPWNQYPAYYEFALEAGILKEGSEADKKVRKEVENCMSNMRLQGGATKLPVHVGVCERILGAITDSTIQSVNGQNMCVNNYDVRLTDTHPSCGMNWPPDIFDITPYLSRDDVKSAFHATRHAGDWTECNGQVGANFYTPNSLPSVTLLPDLLSKIQVLMFAGAEDLICNHVGIERMIENLNWNGATGWEDARAEDWVVDGRTAGTWTTARNMTYVKILDASHMVPYDQPLAAHDMFLRFVGASLLSAAGPAAQVPSRIGNEIPAVLGSTRPDGSSLNATLADGSSVLGSSTSGDDSTLSGSGDSKQLSSSSSSDGWWGTSSLSGSAVEGLAHASSAIVLVLLMASALGAFLYIRRRTGSSSSSRRRGGGSGKGWASLTPRGKRHARAQSLGRGGGRGMGGVEDEEDEGVSAETSEEDAKRMRRKSGGGDGGGGAGEDAHELDELMRSSHARSRQRLFDADEEEHDTATTTTASRVMGRRRNLDEEAKVFGLGDEEEEEEEEDSRTDTDTIADKEGRRSWRE
ncbi:hypothetical protein JCM10908_003269 [Rhodotorula pacifica]|uniref:S10 family peptidase n=1 Tax=Rhodotorula pacifica TaxID=1495444 RepID=UPI00316D2EF4